VALAVDADGSVSLAPGCGYWKKLTVRADLKSEFARARRYEQRVANILAPIVPFCEVADAWNPGAMRRSGKTLAIKLLLAEVAQIDHRVGQRFKRVVNFADVIESKQ
jgi:hypothetical protein